MDDPHHAIEGRAHVRTTGGVATYASGARFVSGRDVALTCFVNCTNAQLSFSGGHGETMSHVLFFDVVAVFRIVNVL